MKVGSVSIWLAVNSLKQVRLASSDGAPNSFMVGTHRQLLDFLTMF